MRKDVKAVLRAAYDRHYGVGFDKTPYLCNAIGRLSGRYGGVAEGFIRKILGGPFIALSTYLMSPRAWAIVPPESSEDVWFPVAQAFWKAVIEALESGVRPSAHVKLREIGKQAARLAYWESQPKKYRGVVIPKAITLDVLYGMRAYVLGMYRHDPSEGHFPFTCHLAEEAGVSNEWRGLLRELSIPPYYTFVPTNLDNPEWARRKGNRNLNRLNFIDGLIRALKRGKP